MEQNRQKKIFFNSLYATNKRLISDVKTHTDQKWGNRKRYFIQMETKRKLTDMIIFISSQHRLYTKIVIRNKKGYYFLSGLSD